MQVDYALAGSFTLDSVFESIKDTNGIDALPHHQDQPELYLAPASDQVVVKDVFDVNFRLVDILALEDVPLHHVLGPSWQCINVGESECQGLEMMLGVICKNKEMHGLLLECHQDKTELLEQGVENPFTGDTPYPLPSPSYLLLYPQLDNDQNQQFLVRLCDWPGYPIDSLIIQCSKWTSSLPSTEGLMDEWDLLSAYDEDVSKREKQFERPEFFAKPRPKLIAKKRQTMDTRAAALKKNQDTSKTKATTITSSTSSTSRKATTPNRAANKYTVKKATAESWESENKNAMKRRVWDRVMKRGFDKRSQQTRLLFQQIYTSVQYVFRRTIKDEEVDTATMIQAIEAHLDFYDQMNQLTQGK